MNDLIQLELLDLVGAASADDDGQNCMCDGPMRLLLSYSEVVMNWLRVCC